MALRTTIVSMSAVRDGGPTPAAARDNLTCASSCPPPAAGPPVMSFPLRALAGSHRLLLCPSSLVAKW